jgi:hypothetical protein
VGYHCANSREELTILGSKPKNGVEDDQVGDGNSEGYEIVEGPLTELRELSCNEWGR